MIASVYIKDGNINLYNEKSSLSGIGGIAYELGKPLLDFVCYEPDQFENGFNVIASAFDNEYAHVGAKNPAFLAELQQMLNELQSREIYLFFYSQMLVEFVLTFIDSPRKAVDALAKKIPGAEERLGWALNFKWPTSSSSFVEVAAFADKEKRLYRAAKDAIALMCEDLRLAQEATIREIQVLLSLREQEAVEIYSPLEYLPVLDDLNRHRSGHIRFLENPFRTFYGTVGRSEVVQFYEIDSLRDLLRFELTKMIEHEIFIKRCKNCDRFFIPRRRADAEYCERIYGDTSRKCSEIGATLRYERKVAGNPILDAHKKAYRRFNSRTRTGKMTQSAFLAWSEEAAKKRDACLAGELPFEEFVAWLEQGRIRKGRSKAPGVGTTE